MNSEIQNTPVPVEHLLQTEPRIYDYDNYRDFLRDYYGYQKRHKSYFSHRYFARKAGLASASYLKVVFDGRRNLSEDGIARFTKALGLTGYEANFFRNLVFFTQADSLAEKQKHAQEMMRSKVYQHLHPLALAKFEYWSKWYNVAIREMVPLENFQEDPKWIAAQLNPTITAEEAAQSLAQLQSLGLLSRNSEGRLVQSEQDIGTGGQVVGSCVAEFHRQMIDKGKEAIDRFERASRQISCVTIGLSDDGRQKVKDLIYDFRRQLLAIAQQDPGADQVCQVNFQFFPLTDEKTKCST